MQSATYLPQYINRPIRKHMLHNDSKVQTKQAKYMFVTSATRFTIRAVRLALNM